MQVLLVLVVEDQGAADEDLLVVLDEAHPEAHLPLEDMSLVALVVANKRIQMMLYLENNFYQKSNSLFRHKIVKFLPYRSSLRGTMG